MVRTFPNLRKIVLRAGGVICLLLISLAVPAQQLAKRLILKDGSYQLVTKWEVKGDRVRYLSAERNEWEEIPNSLVDWPATEKFDKDRAEGVPAPEAVELDKQLAAERAADEARSPEVVPGLRLLDPNTVELLDTFQNHPQLVDLQQNSGEINRDRKGNILRGAINPIASAKQNIELAESHAKVQAHVALPAIYINVDAEAGANASNQPASPQGPELPWDRFKIVRAQVKGNKRIVGAIKISIIGKASQEQNLAPSTSARLTGGWVKITPTTPLASGEYAVVELLGKDGMNLFVWDFGVNPSAPANANALNPDPEALHPSAPKRDTLQKRE